MNKIVYPRTPRDVDPAERQEKQGEASTVVGLIKAIVDNANAFDELLDAADMVYEGVPNARGKFNAACAHAGCNPSQAKYLWNLLTSRPIVAAKGLVDAPFCWA